MALGTSFNTGALVTPADNLGKVLSGLQGQLNTYENQKLAEAKQAALLEQQAAENERAERGLSLREKEYKRAKAQDEALGKALLGIDSGVTTTQVTPAGTKQGVLNLEEIAKAKADQKAALLTKGEQELAGAQYQKLYTDELAKLEAEAKASQPQPEEKGWFDRMLAAGTRGPDAPIHLGGPIPGEGTIDPSRVPLMEQAHKVAAEGAGIVDVTGDTVLPTYQDVAVPEKVIGDVAVPETSKEVEMKKGEWLSREMAKAKDLKLGGAAAKNYQDVLTKRADQLFGKQDPMTVSQQLNLLKYQRGEQEKEGTLDYYNKKYSYVPKSKRPTTVDGFKSLDKQEAKKYSGKDKVSKFAKDMYTAFPEDPGAVKEYLEKHKDKLSKASSENLASLIAEYQALKGQESILDISNWAPTSLGGGTAIGDVLLP